ncbi:MAG TPA: undecaprenyl-diphosphate phosphatase [Bacteroidales bacterium]|nr:undecaprenyl-diphosphate phosphatase [Bacteroidales bacterium]
MNWLEALVLGIVQGLTEFLPISSSGHLELGKALFQNQKETNSLLFVTTVHAATVLSTLIVFRNDIIKIFQGIFTKKWNYSKKYFLMLIFSMLPVVFIGLFFKDFVENLFKGNIFFVGCMLIISATLLFLTKFTKPTKQKPLSFINAFIIGIAQAIAVIPGISRSGATISTGLMLGIKKDEIAKFSFLMVIIPILGEMFLNLLTEGCSTSKGETIPIILGFIAAFISGFFACKFMINIVKKGNLIWFSLYCLIIGLTAILLSFI